MRLPKPVLTLANRWFDWATDREPDQIIGSPGDTYLYRWYLIPRNKVFNIYLHVFARSDDDRALHDHPWWNVSILIQGQYMEVVPVDREVRNGPTKMLHRKAGQIVGRRATAAHRVLLFPTGDVIEHPNYPNGKIVEHPVKTIFITGRRVRRWGFWCLSGFKDWTIFTKPRADGKGSEVGEGCGEYDARPPEVLGTDSRSWTGRA